MINITELASSLTPRYCEFLLGLYCFTGEDSNCAFKGKGKVAPLKKAVQKQKFMDTFIKLGKQWGLDPDSHTELEEFTCTMYGHPRLKEVNKVRSSMMRKITGGNTTAINKVKKVDLSSIPPCKRSLTRHCNHVNYRVKQWKLAHESKPHIEKPTEKHGWTTENGRQEPLVE